MLNRHFAWQAQCVLHLAKSEQYVSEGFVAVTKKSGGRRTKGGQGAVFRREVASTLIGTPQCGHIVWRTFRKNPSVWPHCFGKKNKKTAPWTHTHTHTSHVTLVCTFTSRTQSEHAQLETPWFWFPRSAAPAMNGLSTAISGQLGGLS